MSIRIAISAAAIFAATSLVNSTAFSQIRQTTPPVPATQPAPDPAEVPVKEVVLFSSGVGYFEHAGTVRGDAATELRFKTDQLNDILKSLLLQDTDGGTVGAVSYPGLAPLARTLKSFQVDISANPDMSDLLNQLRGAKLTISLKGEQPMTGVILGVEKKFRPVGDKAVVEAITLNLKVGRKFHAVSLDQVSSMELDDPALQEELDEALAALAQARDQDKKTMTLHFNGKGERHVRIGYLVETPVWKTSYRLVLGTADAEKKPKPAEAKHSATAPGEPAAHGNGLGDGQLHAAKLQGWAIVENQTDNDWTNVELALVSGRPLSFIQDLYHAQYIPRPVVEADNRLSLRPQTYSGGIYDIRDLTTNVPDFTDAPDFSLNSTRNNQNQGGQGGGGMGGGGGGNLFSAGQSKEKLGPQSVPATQPMDPTASIISAATAARVGELFKYRIGEVSVARQASAMIPIVTDDIDAERISIYNAGVLPDHPLLGARLRNNTRKFLLQGPITVLDHGSYAGDARIEDLPAGQERLISFGIDQQLLIDATETKDASAVVTAKIEKGVMFLTNRNVVEQTYRADNRSQEARVLVIEHPRQAEFKLVSPAEAEETTAELFRFRRVIQPRKVAKFTVVQEHVFSTPTQILSLSTINLAAFIKDGLIPQKVRDALTKALQLQEQIATLNSRISEVHKQGEEFDNDQKRIRENLRAVAAESDYYKRLMKKIDAEETELEKLEKSNIELLAAHKALENQLNEYVEGLTVQ